MKKFFSVLLIMLAILMPFTIANADFQVKLSEIGLTFDIPEEYSFDRPNDEAREHGCVAVYYADNYNIELAVYVDTAESTAAEFAEAMKESMGGDESGVMTIRNLEIGYAKYSYEDGQNTVYAVTYFVVTKNNDLAVLSFFRNNNNDLDEFEAIVETFAQEGAFDQELQLGGYMINIPGNATVGTDGVSQLQLDRGTFAYFEAQYMDAWARHIPYNGETIEQLLSTEAHKNECSEVLEEVTFEVDGEEGMYAYICHTVPEDPDYMDWVYKVMLPDGDEVLYLIFNCYGEEAAETVPEMLATLRR